MTTPQHPAGDDATLIAALQYELTHVQTHIEELLKGIHTLFGTVLPLAIAIFTFTSSGAEERGLRSEDIAFAFVAITMLTALWTSNLWMELLPLLRYKYLELQPRLYSATGQTDREPLSLYLFPQRGVSWLPGLAFNLLGLAIVIAVWQRFIASPVLWWGALVFITLGALGIMLVPYEIHRLRQEFQQAREAGRKERRPSQGS
ncbi:hypothetical protein HPC49_02485 [Pyxidicoccus fallax]|uniref:Uncharacterized protein n=1 Tax=Pyxidicoccus fallax TaxID=394095 RepID=A0A848LB28_9BACT|nr:hypothetical protein [Pyxidicoccus fallax]NMO15714.1 hypothetical protein [Pyxidicoccus fallax]NPC77121.1 hypothetical protein [Pyxidicoccus fallax]